MSKKGSAMVGGIGYSEGGGKSVEAVSVRGNMRGVIVRREGGARRGPGRRAAVKARKIPRKQALKGGGKGKAGLRTVAANRQICYVAGGP